MKPQEPAPPRGPASPQEPPAASPPGRTPRGARSPYRSVLKLQNFRRLWLGMTISSLGDWIGFFALLAITNRLAPRNSLAVAGLMMARMLPAFVIGPIAGVALDRLDKRKAMIVADLLRAALIASVPFLDTLPGLYAVAFLLETCALVWMPAKDALVPSLVPARWLVAANSLALFSTYGVFPLGALVFTGLVGTGQFLGAHFESLRGLGLNQENLALWIDTATFLVSVLLVSRIQFPGLAKSKRPIRLSVIWDELTEGLRYFRQRGEITRIVRGIGFALVGGGVIFSLGVPYTTEVLHGGAKGFGAMVAFLGTGMGVGVLLLGLVGHRLSKAWVFASGIISGGLALSLLSVVDRLELAIPVACALGACAGVAYATGFALLQEKVAEEVRGRTFASVQIVIRVSLFLSLTSFPALAELFSTQMSSEDGIRLSMAVGGLLSVAAGTLIARDVFKRRIES